MLYIVSAIYSKIHIWCLSPLPSRNEALFQQVGLVQNGKKAENIPFRLCALKIHLV